MSFHLAASVFALVSFIWIFVAWYYHYREKPIPYWKHYRYTAIWCIVGTIFSFLAFIFDLVYHTKIKSIASRLVRLIQALDSGSPWSPRSYSASSAHALFFAEFAKTVPKMTILSGWRTRILDSKVRRQYPTIRILLTN